MYKVYCDGELIYEPGSAELTILDPQLDLELNSAGQFVFTLPNEHPYYNLPVKMLSRVEVDRNDEMLFYGRIVDEYVNFYKQKRLTCEGELAFLNDSIQRPAEYHDMTVRGYLQTLIAAHNEQVEADKQFTVGIVTVTDSNDSLYRYTNYNSTMTEIKEDLIDDLGGYLRVRHQDGVRYLDYVDIVDYGITNDQAIRFGTNLLDFTEDMDVTDIATVIIPLGERLEESPIEALDMRLTIEDVNNGKDWIQSDEAVELYGKITKTVTWDDVTLPENLLKKGQQYLSDTQWDDVELTATAVDMNLTDAETEAFHLGDQLRVKSDPHGLDRYFPLSKMSLDLDDPQSNSYTLGTSVPASLVGNLLTQTDISEQLGNLSARSSEITNAKVSSGMNEVLQEAKDNATILINAASQEIYDEVTGQINQATACGHVVLEAPYDEILIMDTEDKETAVRVWRWNLNGLGYSKTGYKGEYGLAMTMDGAIVADYITTGTLNANLIRAGVIKDLKGNNSWDLESGELITTSGKIGGWIISSGKIYNDLDNYSKTAAMQAPTSSNTWVFAAGGSSHSSYSDCPFRVDKSGNLYATQATLTGSLTCVNGYDTTYVRNGRLEAYYDGSRTAYFAGNCLYSNTGKYGLRLAGYGVIGILTPYLGVGSYYAPDTYATINVGVTASVSYTHNLSIKANSSGGVSWSYYNGTLTFTKGLLTGY